jgi:iron complex transport system ATP-binding protein
VDGLGQSAGNFSMSLKLNNLTIGHHEDLCKICDYQFPTSGIFAVAGPNGAGKSTLLNTIGNMTRPRAGTVSWQDCNLEEMDLASVAAVITQHFSGISPFGELLVEEIWQMSSRESSIDETVIQYWGCHQLAQKQFSILSDGQKQKVLLIRAMLSKAPVLIFDEPTTHLDFNSVTELENIFTKISKNEQRLVIFSSHDWSLIKRVADQVIYLPLGDQTFIDTPSTVFNKFYF